MEKKTLDDTRVLKIIWIFIAISFFLVIFLVYIFSIVNNDRDIIRLNITKKEMAIRGDIFSHDDFKISTTKKIYKATIDTRYLDINKKELFVKLFSIYSNIPYEKILKKVNKSFKKPSYLVLSYNIDSRTAKNLKELNFKLRSLGVFTPVKINGKSNLTTLDIIESGEKRVYPYKDILTPVVGYIRKYEENNKTKVKGIKGLEKSFNDILNSTEDGVLKGNRDIASYIKFDKNSTLKQRVDGANIHLNIPLQLQRSAENLLDEYKSKLNADEIIISIMESKTGEILSLASSNRFNPENILKKDIPSLNVKAIEYPFEPGSIIKPISIALVLDKNRVKKDELFFAYNTKGKANKKGEYPKGIYKIGRHPISDDHRFKKHYLTLDDIVIFSSNIGTLQLAHRLSGKEILDGMDKFGFGKKTKIELPYERTGILPSLKQISAGESQEKDNTYKATVSYGQGMTATFMQVLKAYSVFNNDGKILTPRLTSFVESNKGICEAPESTGKRVIKKQTAKEIKRLLIKTVEKGTGRSAKIEGLEIGGKTGTAQVVRNGKYQKEYISSFFGFVNDKKNNSYTIGVTVFNPTSKDGNYYGYYASQTAVPVFKEITELLVKQNYLSK